MMPFEIIRNDITKVTADAIVNTANPHPIIGSGTDAAIHSKAGPLLLESRKEIGDIPVGQCAITPAFNLNARYVIHTVGPIWRGGMHGEPILLESCYRSSLETALREGCTSIAFPLISAGSYGYPIKDALQIATSVFRKFLMEYDLHIYLVVYNQEAFLLSQNLFRDVKSYIDEHYIENALLDHRHFLSNSRSKDRDFRNRRTSYTTLLWEGNHTETLFTSSAAISSDRKFDISYPQKAEKCSAESAEDTSLDALLAHTDAGFSETLLKLIDKTGQKDSVIYKKANVSKQLFSKIRNNPDYNPTKPTAVAFAIALELDIEQTKDLIGRAGYALTNSSKFDVIIKYFISRRNYNIIDINLALFQFDQSPLGY